MTQYGDEEYLTAEEASALLGVSRRTLERYAKNKRIKRYRIGLARIVFKKSEVQKLLGARPDEQQEGEDR